jgi:hypothetical protein
MASQKSINRIGQAPRGLRHEPGIRGRRRSRHVNPSAPEIEHEARVVGTLLIVMLDVKQVAGPNRSDVSSVLPAS